VIKKHTGLTDCVDVADVQQTFYNVNNLSNSFYKCRRRYTFEILKEIDLYTKQIVR
jgi:hypothetical protein